MVFVLNALNAFLAPYHFVNYANVGLDDFDYFGGDGVCVVGNGDAIVAIFVHLYCKVNALEEALGIDT